MPSIPMLGTVLVSIVSALVRVSPSAWHLKYGVQVFGYFDPKVVKIPPGGSLRRLVEITWPCRLSDIWNDEREAMPPPGVYKVSVRIGFASTAAPKAPKVGEGVEAPVMAWQKTTVSPAVQIAI